jgi:hypothetical protein
MKHPLKDNESPEDAALRQKLATMIEDLGDGEETFAARQMFRTLLHDHGPHKFIQFIEEKSVIADEEELGPSDFKGHANHAYRSARMKLWSRRGVFSVMAGGYAGAVFAGYGAAAVGGQLEKMATGEESYCEPLKKNIDEHLMPSAELAIGAAIMSESYEAYLSAKLKQISEGVWQINQYLKDKNPEERGR